MNIATNGIILKSLGGFYTVETPEGASITCKPRGLFRKTGVKPVAGDRVLLETEADTYYINEVLPRKNIFVRPPVANVDLFVIVVSLVQPVPNLLVLDTLLSIAVQNEAETMIVLTKTDLAPTEEVNRMMSIYKPSGIEVLPVNAATKGGFAELSVHMQNKLCVFCGNSGVGKTTLLNALLPGLGRETGEISQKLGRGRHTTREVELLHAVGGLVADTPGFSSVEMQQVSPTPKEKIQHSFLEISRAAEGCRFANCAHIAETSCAVLQNLADKNIAQSRYDSYVSLYKSAKSSENKY